MLDILLEWCASILGPVTVAADHSKEHGGHESSTARLLAPAGPCYLKVHRTRAHWEREVHFYEHWAGAFGDRAPRLLAVHDSAPLALLVSELPGQVVEHVPLSPVQERALWRAAGAALRPLHELATGDCFGPCLRDGTPAQPCVLDARAYLSRQLESDVDRAIQGD